eukprot:2281443-Prymnesium_polylepis.1
MSRLNTAAMQDWLMHRPFASALPIQPMLVQPLSPQPPAGIKVTFRRKPTSENGGTDGGLRCTLSIADEDAAAGGVLLVTRISEGQTISKIFSEKMIVKRIVTDLAKLPEECGAVAAVLNMAQPDA